MTINLSSLRACFGIRASNEAPAAAQANPHQSGFCQAVKRLCIKLFQCKSSPAVPQAALPQAALPQAALPQAALPQAALPHALVPQGDPAANLRANQQAFNPKVVELLLNGLAGKLEPETKARLAVALAMTKTWGADQDPLIRFSRASNPENLPDSAKVLSSLSLDSSESNPQALDTLIGLIEKKIYPMIGRALNNPASAASLGNWLSKLLGGGEAQPRLDWLTQLPPPLLQAFDHLLTVAVDQGHSSDLKQPQALIQKALLLKRLITSRGRVDEQVFRGLSVEQKNDKDIAIEIVLHSPETFDELPQAMRADKDFVLATAKSLGSRFESLDDALKSDRDVVLAAVSENGCMLEQVGDEFRADKEIVMAAVKNYGEGLSYASDELKADREVVLHAVRQNGDALKFASTACKADPEVVMQA